MLLGIDASTYLEVLEHGGKFYAGNRPVDPLDDFVQKGVNCMRIRLWVHPYDSEGKPYGAGTCDLDYAVRLSELCVSKGFSIMLDIHYSDFWVDPAKQTLPKGWPSEIDALENKVYTYTSDVLRTFAHKGIALRYIQVGNEITNGMLWPVGRLLGGTTPRGNYGNLIRLLNAGIAACRKQMPAAKLVLHLERSYDQALYAEFFDQMEKAGVDYDVIGMSYYPYWHGDLAQFFANVDACHRFRRPIMAVETSYAFTLDNYTLPSGENVQLVINKDNAAAMDICRKYPVTQEGQAAFVRDFLRQGKRHGLDGVFWWEPLWLPHDGLYWATDTAKEYIGETFKPCCYNEWANQCLYDYEGRRLPACDMYAQSTLNKSQHITPSNRVKPIGRHIATGQYARETSVGRQKGYVAAYRQRAVLQQSRNRALSCVKISANHLSAKIKIVKK